MADSNVGQINLADLSQLKDPTGGFFHINVNGQDMKISLTDLQKMVLTLDDSTRSSLANQLSLGGFTTYTLGDDSTYLASLLDSEGNVIFLIDNQANFLRVIDATPVSSNDDIISRLSALGRTKASAGYLVLNDNNQKPTKKINIFLFYGQSYSIGADSERIITQLTYDNNLMLGNNVYGDAGTGQAFVPNGNSNLNPLVASGKESPSVGFLNELKRLLNESYGVETDQTRLLLTAETGIGARTIEQCLTGDAWTRFDTALQAIQTAVNKAGYDSCVAGIVYMQGENDNGKEYDYYYGKLGQLVTQCTAQVKKYFPNNKDIHFYFSQIGGQFTGQDTLNTERAQLDFCTNNPNATLIAPYQQLPPQPSNIHLLANSYRYFGALAARTVFKRIKGVKNAPFRMIGAYHEDNTVYVGFSVPYPPIVFKNTYSNAGAILFADKGFSVVDSLGTLSGSALTVTIVDDVVIQITCNRNLSGTVTVRLGDVSVHGGRHNIADSDPSLSYYNWEPLSSSAPDNISEFNNLPYSLRNWAGLESIVSRSF